MSIFNMQLTKKNSIVLSFFIPFLFAFPILLCNTYYYDDISRSLSGALGWGSIGRPLADIIFLALSLNKEGSVDLTPLPLVLSLAAMCHGIYLLNKNMFSRSEVGSLIACSIVFLTPMFIQNLVYRYDSLPMVLSLYLCIFSFCKCASGNALRFFISVISLTSSLCLYQTSFPTFCILCICYSMVLHYQYNSNPSSFILKCVLVSTSALSLYFLITNKVLSGTQRSNLIFSNGDWLNSLVNNFINYFNMVKTALPWLSCYLVLLALLAATFSLLYLEGCRLASHLSMRNCFFAIIFIASPTLCFFISSMISTLTTEGLVVPRVATSFGSAVFLSLLAISLSRFKFSAPFIASAIVILSIVTSFVVSSSLRNQYDRDSSIINRIINTVENDRKLQGVPVSFVGALTQERSVNNNSRHFKIVEMIVNPFNDWMSAMVFRRLSDASMNYRMDRVSNMKLFIEMMKSSGAEKICHADYSMASNGKQTIVLLGKMDGVCN
ncbi:hypothetical protein G4U62_16995 [Cronobacter sakazakii]|nr:hypothetical protein G4U62_16995 [Cronobacter sakazakii]TYD51349.1 hypothetical protein FNN14_06885 [Cronobacter sakazakii]